MSGGDKDHRHAEDQGRVRQGEPAPRGTHHGVAPSPQHHSPLRDSQGTRPIVLTSKITPKFREKRTKTVKNSLGTVLSLFRGALRCVLRCRAVPRSSAECCVRHRAAPQRAATDTELTKRQSQSFIHQKIKTHFIALCVASESDAHNGEN